MLSVIYAAIDKQRTL